MKYYTAAERKAFLEYCREDAAYSDRDGERIGTYKEKGMHRILKRFFEPSKENREIPVGRFVADAKRGRNITEIQTASLSGMRDKLACFLDDNNVRIVFPVETERRLLWINPSNGEIEPSKRKAPGEDNNILLEELIYILDYIPHPNLTVTAVYISVDEYRRLDGRGKDKKLRATSVMRLPTDIFGYDDFKTVDDYKRLLPIIENRPFTREEFAKATHRKGRRLWACLKFLEEMDLINTVGKDGRKKLYDYKEKSEIKENKN